MKTTASRQPNLSNRGFSLVELMVSVAISMVVVIAASYVYLGTRETQRTLSEKSFTFESAKFAMDLIGRDIENAGFYPAIRSTTGAMSPNSVSTESYVNPITASPPAAYGSIIYGCQALRYLPVTSVCGAHSGTVDSDAMVVNYYSNDSSGLDIGNRADCLRQDSANDAATNNITGNVRRNAGHAAAAAADRPFLAPQKPLFVSNRYTLSSTTLQVEGQTINTFSLACNGNGQSTASNTYQPMIPGIDQLRFYYLVSDGVNGQYKRANSVTATEWANVTGVRVCLIARSLQAARLRGTTSYSLNDCDGASQSYTDGIERKVFSQVFALKNKANVTF